MKRFLSAKVVGSPRPSNAKPVSEDSGFSSIESSSDGYQFLGATPLQSTQQPQQFPVIFSKVTKEEAVRKNIISSVFAHINHVDIIFREKCP
jgi:hypothetical protein